MSEKQTEVQRLVNTTTIARDLKWHVDAEIELNRLQNANAELVTALQAAFEALDAIYDEMTVGERYTNAGQYLIDAFPVVRDALEKHGGE